jgi:DNA-binding NarL/FixJ family response regulator
MRGETIIGVLRLVLSGEKYIPPFLFDYREDLGRKETDTPSNKAGPLAVLSARELDILSMIVDGAPNKTIARALELQEVTVKAHLRNIFRKIAVSNRTEAARTAILAGLPGASAKGNLVKD